MQAILVDDEHLALDLLSHQLKKFTTVNIIGCFTEFDVTQSAELLQNTNIVFLDIDMPNNNGLDLAEKITAINPSISIVFVTAYDEFAIKAFELDALDYLLKPIKADRLKKTIDRIFQNESKRKMEAPTEEELIINVSHELSFELSQQTISIKWRTKKSRELLLYLLHHRGKSIHKAELVELFWPESKDPFAQLYTTIYHIRKSLAEFKNYIQIDNKNDYYQLLLTNTKVDLFEWEKRMKQLLPLTNENSDTFEKTMKLYKHAYLETYNYVWAESDRFRLEQLWLNYAWNIAMWYQEKGKIHNAITWLQRIVNTKSDHEMAHFSLLKLYSQLKEINLVKTQYNTFTTICADMGIKVSDEIRQWYSEWEKENTTLFS
ncbi:response regulator [Paraliobacillus salinarum]|uniref:response regulator n=1 Tax=Paraliobacillus salinarum TaxID=1158996 RepID=UPI0015F5883A|nr:response regulator [Paraliobacillus salinarum]